jgi:transposase-like protein
MSPDRDGQPACPQCGGHGIARSVSIKGDQRIVSYECENCRRGWDVTDDDPRVNWYQIGASLPKQ